MSPRSMRKCLIRIAFPIIGSLQFWCDDANPEMTEHTATEKCINGKDRLSLMVTPPQYTKLVLVIPFWSTSVIYKWGFCTESSEMGFFKGFELWCGWSSF